MSEPEPESVDALLAQVCRLHHMRAHVLLEEIGPYRGQPPVLFHLQRQDGLTLTDLVAHLEVAPATVTKMVQRLERAGFVQRAPDGEDQRVTRVYLTEAGRAIQRKMRAVLQRLEGESFAGLSAEERGRLSALLVRVRANLTHTIQPAAPSGADGDEPASDCRHNG
jgi:DNA-binding MarR family transcriptional regulator